MTGRHARTNRHPSRARSIIDRFAHRPARVALVVVSGVAIAAPMVAAQPLAAPAVDTELAVESTTRAVTAASPDVRTDRPGRGPINTVGLASILVANHSSNKAGTTASEMSAAAVALREAAAAEAARQAAEAARAAEQEAARQEAARQEAARQAEAQRAAEAAPAPAPAVSTGSAWDRLAQCESGGNWAINTGNGYYGGLQFSLASWRGVGGTGYPHQASRETQIAMGERLKAQGGWGHWPACSRKLGLR